MNVNTTVTYCTSEQLWNKPASSDTTSDPSRSRRCSTESIYSIQGRETDLLRDTSDTEWWSSDVGPVEFEPVTEPEEEGPVHTDSSGNTDNEIIATKVIEMVVGDDGDLELADSERTASGGSDSEMDYHDYWHCAQCRARNNNPLYRYCEKCFKVRKNFFPPRPKRKHKLDPPIDGATIPRTLSQDSGVESAANSQELSQGPEPHVDHQRHSHIQSLGRDVADGPAPATAPSSSPSSSPSPTKETRLGDSIGTNRNKRRADSADRNNKRIRVDYSASQSDTDSEPEPKLAKMASDPGLTVTPEVKLTKRTIANSLKDLDKDNMCIMCCSEPKSGVFVHGRIAHICCCYNCARRVWAKSKRCPVCNCKVSNVLRAVVM